MAFDILKGQGGRDWSCGIGDPARGESAPWGAIAGGAVAIAAVGAGVLIASGLGGRNARRTVTSGPPTLYIEPSGGKGTSGRYAYKGR